WNRGERRKGESGALPLRGLAGENKRADDPPSLTPYHGKRDALNQNPCHYSMIISVYIKKDQQAQKYFSEVIEKMERYEKERLNDIDEFYVRQCKRMDVTPKKPSLSEREIKWEKIIPKRNPELKGTFGILNTYPEDKYVFEKYTPMYAYLYELFNLMDGQRDMLEIIRTVEAEALASNYKTFSYEEIMDFLQLLKKEEIITY
ncbi:MAG: hypothetical protein ACLFVG_10060, partial [Candidatus Aminicenantes bacterium]